MTDSFSKKVRDGFVWESVAKLVIQVFSWCSTIWVAQILTPDDYGMVGIAGIFTGFLMVLAGFGVSAALINREVVENADLSAGFLFTTVTGFGLYALLFIASPYIESFYELEGLSDVIRVSGIVLITASVRVTSSVILMREMNFKYSALATMASNAVLIALALSLALNDFGYWSLVLSTVISQIFLVIAYSFRVTWTFEFSRVYERLKWMLNFGLKILSANLFAFFNQQVPRVYISLFLAHSYVGIYQLAATIADLPITKIGMLFERVAFPAISRIKENPEQAKDLFLKLHAALFFITCPIFLGIAVISEDLVDVLLGEKWQGIVFPLQVICILNLMRGNAKLIPRVIEGMGHAGQSLKIHWLSLWVMGIGLFVGVQFGFEGVFWAWLFVYPIIYVRMLWAAKVYIGSTILDMVRVVLPPLLSSLSMVCSILLISYYFQDAFSVSWLVLKILIGVVTFVTTYLLIWPKDFKFYLSYIKKR